jgi:hypothetical protein
MHADDVLVKVASVFHVPACVEQPLPKRVGQHDIGVEVAKPLSAVGAGDAVIDGRTLVEWSVPSMAIREDKLAAVLFGKPLRGGIFGRRYNYKLIELVPIARQRVRQKVYEVDANGNGAQVHGEVHLRATNSCLMPYHSCMDSS